MYIYIYIFSSCTHENMPSWNWICPKKGNLPSIELQFASVITMARRPRRFQPVEGFVLPAGFATLVRITAVAVRELRLFWCWQLVAGYVYIYIYHTLRYIISIYIYRHTHTLFYVYMSKCLCLHNTRICSAVSRCCSEHRPEAWLDASKGCLGSGHCCGLASTALGIKRWLKCWIHCQAWFSDAFRDGFWGLFLGCATVIIPVGLSRLWCQCHWL